ncbi:unnamed protein product [Clonostachys solani]|uniref:Uncharacterized protein n=1 Tax=Clonostachys solani TaxID=160281 RepID=A0A9N9W8G8_9HYPO|nr:unnamed protein product [Clonostachys solani]
MPDGFIRRAMDDETCDFTASPVKFLKAIISRIRFNCEGIEKTHLGKILEGALLTEDDFRGQEARAQSWDEENEGDNEAQVKYLIIDKTSKPQNSDVV